MLSPARSGSIPTHVEDLSPEIAELRGGPDLIVRNSQTRHAGRVTGAARLIVSKTVKRMKKNDPNHE
jgi:hypothetical protein